MGCHQMLCKPANNLVTHKWTHTTNRLGESYLRRRPLLFQGALRLVESLAQSHHVVTSPARSSSRPAAQHSTAQHSRRWCEYAGSQQQAQVGCHWLHLTCYRYQTATRMLYRQAKARRPSPCAHARGRTPLQLPGRAHPGTDAAATGRAWACRWSAACASSLRTAAWAVTASCIAAAGGP